MYNKYYKAVRDMSYILLGSGCANSHISNCFYLSLARTIQSKKQNIMNNLILSVFNNGNFSAPEFYDFTVSIADESESKKKPRTVCNVELFKNSNHLALLDHFLSGYSGRVRNRKQQSLKQSFEVFELCQFVGVRDEFAIGYDMDNNELIGLVISDGCIQFKFMVQVNDPALWVSDIRDYGGIKDNITYQFKNGIFYLEKPRSNWKTIRAKLDKKTEVPKDVVLSIQSENLMIDQAKISSLEFQLATALKQIEDLKSKPAVAVTGSGFKIPDGKRLIDNDDWVYMERLQAVASAKGYDCIIEAINN